VEALPGTGVELPSDVVLRDMGHGLSLGQILPDEAIGVLVRATFPGVVRRGEEERNACGGVDVLVAMELRAVVSGDRADGQGSGGDEADRSAVELGDGPGLELCDEYEASRAFDEREDAVFVGDGTEHGVCFPVADLAPVLGCCRTLGDVPLPGESATRVVAAVSFATFLGGLPEVGV
jgi:hypothetical protein